MTNEERKKIEESLDNLQKEIDKKMLQNALRENESIKYAEEFRTVPSPSCAEEQRLVKKLVPNNKK